MFVRLRVDPLYQNKKRETVHTVLSQTESFLSDYKRTTPFVKKVQGPLYPRQRAVSLLRETLRERTHAKKNAGQASGREVELEMRSREQIHSHVCTNSLVLGPSPRRFRAKERLLEASLYPGQSD